MPAAAGPPGGSGYSYYRSMMGRLYSASGPSGMMGSTSSRGAMMGETGYRWMMGGLDAPAWMQGSALPSYMMGTSHDPGQIMGTLFANAPGPGSWFLGNPTSAGMHAATLSFTASTPGTYRYLCPVPGHAQEGMTGTFTVSGT